MSTDTNDKDYVLGFRPNKADPTLLDRMDAAVPFAAAHFGMANRELSYQTLIPLLLNHAMDSLGVPRVGAPK